jgi:hypothetical protein
VSENGSAAVATAAATAATAEDAPAITVTPDDVAQATQPATQGATFNPMYWLAGKMPRLAAYCDQTPGFAELIHTLVMAIDRLVRTFKRTPDSLDPRLIGFEPGTATLMRGGQMLVIHCTIYIRL